MTMRMPRLQMMPPLANMSRECQEHFHPSKSTAATELGYLPLSIETMSGLFTIFSILTVFSTGTLFEEIFWHRRKNANPSTTMVRMIYVTFKLKENDEIESILQELLLTNKFITVMSISDMSN
jgi:hypothetical protein